MTSKLTRLIIIMVLVVASAVVGTIASCCETEKIRIKRCENRFDLQSAFALTFCASKSYNYSLTTNVLKISSHHNALCRYSFA